MATDRRGPSRAFPIDGTDDAPCGFRSTMRLDNERAVEALAETDEILKRLPGRDGRARGGQAS